MSGPTSNEAPAAEAVESVDPVAEAVSELPQENLELDFASRVDQMLAEENKEPEPEPEPEPESEPEPEPEPDTGSDLDDADPTTGLSEDLGDDWTPKAASRFKQLKTELKETTSELKDLRHQNEAYEQKIKELTGVAENKDVEALQEKLAEYEKEKMFTNLEQTTAYQEAVAQPLEQIINEADELAEKYDIDADSLTDILSLSDPEEQDKQLSVLLSEATDRDKARVYRMIDQIEPLMDKREALKSNAEAALKEAEMLKEEQERQEAAENLALRKNAARNVVAQVKRRLPFLSSIEGLDFDAVAETASENDPSVLHPVDSTFQAVSAKIFPKVINEFMSLRRENAALTDALAKYENAEPKIDGNTPAPTASPDEANPNASFEDRIDRAFSTEGLSR